MRSRALLTATALATSAVLTMTGCSGGATPKAAARPTATTSTPGRNSVALSPTTAAALRLSSGVEVDVPAGATSGTGELTGAVITPPAAAPAGLVLDGPVYDLHLSGATLTGQATLRFPAPTGTIPAGSKGPNTALLAYYDTVTSRWTPVPASYDDATGTLTATSPHLSLWTRLTFDSGAFLKAAGNGVLGFFDAKSTVAQPSCPNESAARNSGVKVASDSGDLIKWCVGRNAAGEVISRVANNRHYSMLAE